MNRKVRTVQTPEITRYMGLSCGHGLRGEVNPNFTKAFSFLTETVFTDSVDSRAMRGES